MQKKYEIKKSRKDSWSIVGNTKPSHIEPTVRIGKNGLTLGVVDEIKKQLKARGIVKIKLLRSSLKKILEIKGFGLELAEKTGSFLKETRGHTIVLMKRKKL
ncbi:MAG: YhbY family RNA-binding protein [Candidatus Woesearchaeota archaeon]